MSLVRRRLTFFILFLIAIGVTLIACPLVPAIGPAVEGWINPVVSEMRVAKATSDSEVLSVEIHGYKMRPECKLVDVVALSFNDDSPYKLVNLSFQGEMPNSFKYRPSGYQNFGVWTISPVSPGAYVKIVTRHSCHVFWNVVSTIGPFEVKK